MFNKSTPRPIDVKNGEIDRRKITSAKVKKLESLLENPGIFERKIDKFISANIDLLFGASWWASTGHHGCWVYPKQTLRGKISSDKLGLIPDFLIRGQNSTGDTWFLVELKGPKEKLVTKKGGRYVASNKLNEGLWQLLEYLEFCSRSEMYFRDQCGFENFKNLKGVLVIGREGQYKDERAQKLIHEWNHRFGGSIHIMTYDRILNIAKREAECNEIPEGTMKIFTNGDP